MGFTEEEKKDETPEVAKSGNTVASTSDSMTFLAQQHRGVNSDVFQKIAPSSNPDAAAPNVVNQTNATKKPARKGGLWGFLRFAAHLVLFLLAVSLATTNIIRTIFKEYYIPIMRRAQRSNRQLKEEYTYYDRTCNVLDLTATPADAQAMIYQSKETAVDTMMTHGAIMFSDFLSDPLLSELREFVVAKNAAVKGTSAEYPMSQGKKRISYGFEAAEHPTVVRALKAIHDNKELKHMLEELVGKNPALTEITAITSFPGARDQVWHSDVKTDGYAAKFGRTYSHSYSLFIPLQNTTGRMGATDVCPGTQYCTDEDLTEFCDEFRVGMHEVGGDGVWKAGDAALLNQQVWHRGAMHNDKRALERIIFIVSFIARPIDNRQLARGTYFHLKWNMWGHTLRDLADSGISMAWPFNLLRCFHLWKPKDRDWGYDLLIATAMRAANRQGGCRPNEVHKLASSLYDLGFPEFLFGTIDEEDKHAWKIFIKETIANVYDFFKQVNIAALYVYVAFILIAARFKQGAGESGLIFILGSTARLLMLYLTVVGLMVYILNGVRTSPWGEGISSGRTLMRPFPDAPETLPDNDPAVSKGPTTLPVRTDVLLGTRMNTKQIGAYRRWMEFHPGNLAFQDHVYWYGGPQYRSYEQGLPKVFGEKLIDDAFDTISASDGRFLHQDYRTGDWRWMTPTEAREFIRLGMWLGYKSLLAALKDSFDLLTDDYRYGFLRKTALSRASRSYLMDFEAKLFGPKDETNSTSSQPPLGIQLLRPCRLALSTGTVKSLPTQKSNNRWTTFPQVEIPEITILSEVLYRVEELVMLPATIIGYSAENDTFSLAFYGDDTVEYGSITDGIKRDDVFKINPPVEGDRVAATFRDGDEWFPATLARVRASGQAAVQYDDGDFESAVYPQNYFPLEDFRKEFGAHLLEDTGQDESDDQVDGESEEIV